MVVPQILGALATGAEITGDTAMVEAGVAGWNQMIGNAQNEAMHQLNKITPRGFDDKMRRDGDRVRNTFAKKTKRKSKHRQYKSDKHWIHRTPVGTQMKPMIAERTPGFGYNGFSETSQMGIPFAQTQKVISEKTVYSYSLTYLEDTTNANAINKRKREIIKLNGVKFDLFIKNETDDFMFVNVAVVIPKYKNLDEKHLGYTAIGDFFRNDGRTAARSLDFNVNLHSRDYSGLAINTDEYNVLYHRRTQINKNLANNNTTVLDRNNANYVKYSKYLKLNKLATYDDILKEPNTGPLLLLFWVCKFDKLAGVNPDPNACSVQIRGSTYFNAV